MIANMHWGVVLDAVAVTSGLASSVFLLVTAIRSKPLQALLDKVEGSAPEDPGYAIALAVSDYAKNNLAKVKLWDPRLLYTGLGLLVLSYFLSMVKDFFFFGG
ncbi:MAG TPA: hypothetical protein VGF71_04815 [Caulobacteraceae bacterium]